MNLSWRASPIRVDCRSSSSSPTTAPTTTRCGSRSGSRHRPLLSVRISRNLARLGFAGNFLQAARLCRGDLIAWSDQDDVWMAGKLARCVEEFERDSDVRLVVHSRQIGMQTRRGQPLARGGPNDRSSSMGRPRRAVFTPGSLPLWFSAPGMASVLDRGVLEIGDSLAVELPGNFEEYGHDTWTAFLAAAVGKTVFLPDVLARYRLHGGNVFGVAEHSSNAARVRASATRDRSTFQKELERVAAKASFRTDVLLQLSRQNGGRGPLTRAAQVEPPGTGTPSKDRVVRAVAFANSGRSTASCWRRACRLRSSKSRWPRPDVTLARHLPGGVFARLIGTPAPGVPALRARSGAGYLGSAILSLRSRCGMELVMDLRHGFEPRSSRIAQRTNDSAERFESNARARATPPRFSWSLRAGSFASVASASTSSALLETRIPEASFSMISVGPPLAKATTGRPQPWPRRRRCRTPRRASRLRRRPLLRERVRRCRPGR